MGADSRNLPIVGLVFGGMGALISLIWGVGFSRSVPQTDQTVSLALVVVVSTVVTAMVGAAVWPRVVGQFGRWTTPIRGAIAGGVTIWGSLVLTVPVVVLVSQQGDLALSPTILFEALGLALLAGTVGMLYVGAFLLPIGFLTGYLLGRRLTPKPGPIPVLSRIG